MNGLPQLRVSHAALALAIWVCLADVASGLVLRQGDPNFNEVQDFQEKAMAEEYMKKWEGKEWDKAKKSCDLEKLPAVTDGIIHATCGDKKGGEDATRCICNIAKAHSCHVGCTKMKAICPEQCTSKHCAKGDPSNGGSALSEDWKGTCYNYCSAYMGGHRYCGVGGLYQAGLFKDCTPCNPLTASKAKSPKQKKEQWTSCMAGCFPTPKCSEMCGEGTPECYANCVDKYRHVVEPYWEIFKHSSTNLLPKANATVAGQEVVMAEGESKVAPEEPVPEPVKEVAPEEPVEKEIYEDEEEEYVDDYGDEEGEWVDPWAGENEWDDEEYGDDEEYYFLLRRPRMTRKRRRRRRSPELKAAIRKLLRE